MRPAFPNDQTSRGAPSLEPLGGNQISELNGDPGAI